MTAGSLGKPEGTQFLHFPHQPPGSTHSLHDCALWVHSLALGTYPHASGPLLTEEALPSSPTVTVVLDLALKASPDLQHGEALLPLLGASMSVETTI